MPSSRVEQVLHEARRYIGTVEEPIGSNRGLRIDYWLFEAVQDWRDFPIGVRGAPWCAAFVSQVGVQALGRVNWPVPVSVSCQRIADWATQLGISAPLPHVGDLFLLYYERHRRYGHIGFVADLLPDNRFVAIEGNTNTGGSREGYGVFERERKVHEHCAFVHWHVLP